MKKIYINNESVCMASQYSTGLLKEKLANQQRRWRKLKPKKGYHRQPGIFMKKAASKKSAKASEKLGSYSFA